MLRGWIKQDLEGAIDHYLQMDTRYPLFGQTILNSREIESSSQLFMVMDKYGPRAETLLREAKLRHLPPSEALELALSGNFSHSGMYSIFSRWPFEQMAEGLQKITEIKEKNIRQSLYQSFLDRHMRINPMETYETLNQFIPTGHADRQAIMLLFARADPNLTRDILLAYAQESGDYAPLVARLGKMLQYDPQAALAEFESIPEGRRQSNFYSFAHQLGRSDPELAYNWITSRDLESQRHNYGILSSLIQQHPRFVEDKLNQEHDPKIQSLLIVELAQWKARNNPVKTLEWLEEYSNTTGYAGAVNRVTNTWANSDPKNMLLFAQAHADERAVVRSVKHATRSWYGSKPEEAKDWVLSLDDNSPVRNMALIGITSAMVYKQPRDAYELAQTIQGNQRNNTVVNIVSRWALSSPQDLEDILASVDLDDPSKTRVRNYVELHSYK